MIWSCIESDIVIISSCRAARPDPHHSRCTVIGASHYPRITDLMKTDRFVMFFHCRTLCSSPSTKIYQEWSTRWTVFTCLARRQIPCGCWDLMTESRIWWKTGRFVMFFHCRTFHSAPIVNCTENGPLPVSSVDSIYMFGKEADTMRMLRSEDQNRGFDEKPAVLWCFFNSAHSIQLL